MATQLAAVRSTRLGAESTPTANPSGEYAFPNGDQDFVLVVDNTGAAAAVDVTVWVQSSVVGRDVPDLALVSVPAGDLYEFGPFDAANFNVKSGADVDHVIVLFANGDANTQIWGRKTGSLT